MCTPSPIKRPSPPRHATLGGTMPGRDGARSQNHGSAKISVPATFKLGLLRKRSAGGATTPTSNPTDTGGFGQGQKTTSPGPLTSMPRGVRLSTSPGLVRRNRSSVTITLPLRTSSRRRPSPSTSSAENDSSGLSSSARAAGARSARTELAHTAHSHFRFADRNTLRG